MIMEINAFLTLLDDAPDSYAYAVFVQDDGRLDVYLASLMRTRMRMRTHKDQLVGVYTRRATQFEVRNAINARLDALRATPQEVAR